MDPPSCVTSPHQAIRAFTKCPTLIGLVCPVLQMVGGSCQDGLLLSLSYSLSWSSIRVFRFDLFSFDFTGPEDETGILNSRDEVNNLIEQEINQGIPSNRIVIGGFSQGATMTLFIGLTTTHKLAGLTVLSGRLTILEKLKEVCRMAASGRGLTRLW